MISDPAPGDPVRVLCPCGRAVALAGDRFRCACGAEVGLIEDGVAVVPPLTPYWGEIPKEAMDRLLAQSRALGWRDAVSALSAGMRDNIMAPERYAFADVLPVPDGSRILDLGAGLGCLAAGLARRHRVVALEGVSERAQFIALRQQQDGLKNLTVLNADLNAARFDDAQFDVVILNGVLEWVGLFDLTVAPGEAQLRFLERIRRVLKPGGLVYLGIENRTGWDQIRGAVDHSGKPYTSLMPRFLAHMICSRGGAYRSAKNDGYRTYTYTYRGCRKLFRRAGLDIGSMWIAPSGYNLPSPLVPLTKAAIDAYTAGPWRSASRTPKARIGNLLKRALARPSLWRLFGSDFVFLLKKRRA